MGLSRDSMGIKSVDFGLEIRKRKEDDKVIALAGNPNVGKTASMIPAKNACTSIQEIGRERR